MTADNAINRSIESLRREGYKITPARRAVIDTLAQELDHMTAPEVVAAVSERAPRVGRASVYRVLELLTKLGLVQASALGRAAATYILTPAGHHHHVICVACRKTVEFDECALRELERSLARRLGFQIEGHLVEVYGRCPDCL